mgnify:CR=1 FL=1
MRDNKDTAKILSRKERRKEKRNKKRKNVAALSTVESGEKSGRAAVAPKKQRKDAGKSDLAQEISGIQESGKYVRLDPDVAAALQRDDEEIAELEAKLGLSSKKNKRRLNKEYAKLEGYGDDFVDFLDERTLLTLLVTDKLYVPSVS